MYLVIGGFGQDKLSWFEKQTGRRAQTADGEFCSLEEAEECEVLNHFHLLLKRFLEEGKPAAEILVWVQGLREKNPKRTIISDEIGCGIVPICAQDRQWRETVGRACCILAEQAERVDRVICGVGIRLKEGGEPCFPSLPF